MKEAKTLLEFRGYCTQCKRGFFLPRGPKILCDMGHHLANDFPYDSFWNYCCGCDAFYVSTGLEGKEAESSCPCCDRLINRRFFCNTCNVMTVEAVDSESRRRTVEFSEDGCPFPWCPGCLLPTSAAKLLIHECYVLYEPFLTERRVCPFCNDAITMPAKVERAPEVLLQPEAKVQRKASFAFLDSFPHRDVSFLNWRSYLPSSRRGRRQFVAVTSFILTALGAVLAVYPGMSAAILWHIKKTLKDPLIVSRIDCTSHFVLAGDRLRLSARAKAPFEELRFNWTTNAGNLINQKDQSGQSEIELDTGNIWVLSVPKEVSISVTIGDQYGETVQHHERITVMPRLLTNHPPRLTTPPTCNCSNQQVVAGERVSLYAIAEDENIEEVLTYQWRSSIPSAELIPITSADGSSVILNTAGVNPRTAPVPVKIYVKVSDSNGGEVMDDITINVLPKDAAGIRPDTHLPPPNRAPKLESFTADKTEIDPGEPVRLWAFVTDADGDSPIYYNWRASAGEIENRNETAILTTTGISTPEVIVFLTVGDNRGGQTSQRLFVKIRNLPVPAASPSLSPIQAKANDDHGRK
jgi:hypothetical protein